MWSSRRAASACSTTSCSKAACSTAARPDALVAVLGRRCAGDARPRCATSADDPLRARSRATTSSSPMAAASRWSPPTRRSAPARCVPIYNALDPATHHPVPRRPALRGRPRLPRQPPARPRGAGRGVLPRACRARCPAQRSCSAATAGTTSRCRANVRARRPRLHARPQRLQLLGRRRCSTSAATAWRAIGFSPATRVFEAAGAGACLITDAWEGIESSSSPSEEILVARDGARGGGASSPRSRRSARAASARAARRACSPSTPTISAARCSTGGCCEPRRVGARKRRERAPDARRRRPRPVHHARPGATATRRPIAPCRALAARGHDVLFLERDVPWYAEHRDLPRSAVGRTLRSTRPRRAADALRAGRSRRRTLVIVGSYVPDGVAVGDWVQRDAQRA